MNLDLNLNDLLIKIFPMLTNDVNKRLRIYRWLEIGGTKQQMSHQMSHHLDINEDKGDSPLVMGAYQMHPSIR